MAISRYLGTPLFAAMAIVQVVRLVEAWPVTVNGFSVPLWASAVGAAAFAILAVLIWRDDSPRRSR